MADEIIQDPLEAANYLLRQYRDNPNFEFTQEEASLVHNAYQGGVSFVDSKPVMDEASTSSFLRSQDESDPTFVASEEEFSILKATEPGAMSRIGGAMAGAAEYFGPVIKEGIPELIKTASMREPRPGDPSLPATLLEAGARGTVDLGTMAVGASKFIEKAPFMAAGALGLQDDYKSYLNQKTIDQNYQMQAIDKMNAERAQGKSIIGLPEGTFAPKAAEAASMVLDPTLAVPFIGPGAKATGVAGRGLGATTKIAGGIETAARATGGAIDLGVEKVGQGIQRVLPGVTAPKTAGAIATGAAAIGIPGAFPIGAKVAGVRAGAEIAERGAQAVRIAGEEAMTGPSRMTVMERVAKNQKNPEWLRKAANTSIVSSPITQGAAELGLETGKGAVKSAAVGAGLGYVASGGEEEGIGGGLVIGGGLGGIGGAVKGVAAIPAKKALAKQGDVNRLFARQADLGLDVNKIADYVRKDNRPFLDAATLQMMAPDVQVEFHSRDSFMMPENAGINAAGVVKGVQDRSGKFRLLINMDDKRSTGDTVRHEILHAIQKSPAINKSEGRMAVMTEYGEEGLRRRGNEYARKLLEGERQGRGTPTEAEVRAKANELREASQRSEPGAGDLDWIADEVLAEQFVGESRGRDLDSLRRRTLPGTNLLSLQEGFLAPVGRLLNKFGIDTTGPKPTNIDTLFKDNPLVPSKQLRELTARWFRDRDKYLDGLEKAEKQKDVTLVPGPGNRNLANNPAIQFTRNRKTNLEENDFAVRFPDGTVRAKDPASILAVDKARVADVGRLYNPDAVLERGSPEFGVKIQSDGKPYVGGNTLPEGFFSLDSFNDFTKEVAKALQDSRKEGKTYSVWYQKVGTGEDGSWAQSVKRGLGNIKVGQSEIAFLGWRLSKAGNILAQAVDISALRGRMLDFARSGKGRINEVWGGDLASYEKDVMQYLDNHANERPGETGIGIDKRNAINYLFGITNIANKNANPMYAAEGRPPGSLVKSYRLDRIANSRDTGRTGFFFDYQKQAANLAPGDVSLQKAIRDKMPRLATPEQVKAIIKPGQTRGVNEEDIKWSGINEEIDRLASENAGKVPRDKLEEFLAGRGKVQLEETRYGSAKGSKTALNEQDIVRLNELEVADSANPLGGMDDEMGDGAYGEMMDLQNRRDNISTSSQLTRMAMAAEEEARAFLKNSPTNLGKIGESKIYETFDRMMKKAEHLNARAEQFDRASVSGNAPRFGGYTIPGGKNYREVVLSKKKESGVRGEGPYKIEFKNAQDADDFLTDISAAGLDELDYGRISGDDISMNDRVVEFNDTVTQEIVDMARKYDAKLPEGPIEKAYISKHYPKVTDYIAHMRLDERPDSAGRDGLFIEEIQSDRHQEGRKYGYKEDDSLVKLENEFRKKYGDPIEFDKLSREDQTRWYRAEGESKIDPYKSVPDAPFRKDWPIQMFKRALAEAVDSGKKWIGWTVGAEQQERYPGMAENSKAGMAKFYDEMLPSEIGKYMKQYGAPVEKSSITNDRYYVITQDGRTLPMDGKKSAMESMKSNPGSRIVEPDKIPMWKIDITPEVVAGVRKMQEMEKEFSGTAKNEPKFTSLIGGEEQKQFAPASPEEIKDEEFWVSQRNPKAVRATENPLTEKLTIGLDVILKDKELAKKQADLIKKYPGFSPKSKTTEGILGEFVDHVKGNLLYLYDSFKPELREEAKKWYDGARKISEEWAGKYGTNTRQNAGVLAVLSPQKDWFMNVSLANRVIDINTNKSKEVFSQEMFNWLKSDPKRAILAKAAKKNLLGKRYDQISDTFDKAVFLRAWDEVNNSRSFDVYSPNGQTLGKKLNDDGSEGKVAWGSFPQIEKGISILGNGARENIHNQLGEEHKVRNFFNNILQPNSKFGDVTIDTHAVAAGLLRPLSGGSTEVLHNLGGGPSSKIVGASGTYALFAEAYRNAAKERGVLPREMQSITWEAIRGLFKPTFKGQAKNKAFVDDVWSSYTKGKVKIDEARDTISKFAGGIEDPSWARRSGQVPTEGGTATNAGELPERGVARQDGDGRTGRGVRGATARNVQTQDLESAVKSRLIKKQLEAKK